MYNLGEATVTNCTFSANTSVYSGGGIANASTLTVVHSTFYDNSASSGAGIFANYSPLTIIASILADNTGGSCGVSAENGGTIDSGGYNISDDDTCGFGTSTGANGQTIGDKRQPDTRSQRPAE